MAWTSEREPSQLGETMFWGGQNIGHMLGKMIEDKTREMAKEGFRPGRYMTREGRTGKDGSGW